MNQQILLLCLNANYSGWAVNFAATLRANGGNYPIKLITNGDFIKEDERKLFDDVEQMLFEHYTNSEGKFSPGWAKLHLDKYSSADITLYLDIDAVCIGSVAPLFDVGSCGFNTQVESKTKVKEHEWNCQWMPLEEVKKTYQLNSDVPLTEINSSYMVWDKRGRAVFEQARKNYLPKYRRPLWGNSFPDELAINVALNQIAFDPNGYPAIQFLAEQNNRPILGFYGGKNYLPKRHTSKYDLYSRAATKKVLGRFPNYRFDELVKGKHVESKRSVQTKIDHTGIVIKSTLSSIPCDFKPEEAIVIENNQMLRQTDYGEAKNFLNGSICLHNGELLYAYRIEHYDSWWRNSRIAITTLDKNRLEPNGAGYLLEGLTSDKGLHVEDPRLFSDGGKLSMAYTDGHSMYCATDFDKHFKTSKKLLRNSDFIPNHDGREKNWTFIPNRTEMVTNFDTNIQLSSGVTLPEGLRWEFGTIRGGTPLVKLPDGNLITFFHSKREFKIPKQFAVYYGGAALFDANLKVLGYSKKPMFIPPYLDRGIARPSVNINCVFPAGLALIGDDVLISCGENDYRTVVYRISLKKILSLIL